ncbi:MAG: hypothetical protein KA770_00215 [Shewanella sp.]|nr:hypothetical protein [Shewanella sp.]
MKYALIDDKGIVQNIIIYDGVSQYDPYPMTLELINDWLVIGDLKTKSNPDLESFI